MSNIIEEAANRTKEEVKRQVKKQAKKYIRKILFQVIKAFLMAFGKYLLIIIPIVVIVSSIVSFLVGNGNASAYNNNDFSSVTYDGTLYGATTEEKIWNFLIAKGATKEGAAAMMGNIERESTFNIEATNGTHTGLCQWSNNDRFLNLEKYAETKGTEWNDLATQLEFMWQEIETTYKKTHTAITTTKDIDGATIVIRDNFEVPFSQAQIGTADEIEDARLRKEFAHKWYEKFKDLNTSVLAMTNGINLYNSDGTVNEDAIEKLNDYLTKDVLNTTIHKNGSKNQNGPFEKWWTSSYTNLTEFQCTWWAFGRASQYLELTGSKYTKYPTQHGNGGKYYGINAYGGKDGCGCGNCNGLQGGWFEYGSSPRANSIISWSGGQYGHVAYVEAVDSTGIWISHANNGEGWYGVEKIPLNGIPKGWKNYTLNGYIYLDYAK